MNWVMNKIFTWKIKSNIISLLSKIKETFPEAIIVIVDDSNQKENRRLKLIISKSKFRNDKDVILISRFIKSGRGSAVLRGYEELFLNKSIKYFYELDADLSHNPAEALSFLSEIKRKKADIVIGSRYLNKSKITKWPLRRKVLSKIYNKFINTWLGLELSDYTNGFRLYNRKAVGFLLKIQLKEKGFIALSEAIFRLKKNGFKIIEIPITFTDRKRGKSSAGINEYKMSIIGILRIRLLPLKFRN
jgi:dolichol-phosphate mannosyltransferase